MGADDSAVFFGGLKRKRLVRSAAAEKVLILKSCVSVPLFCRRRPTTGAAPSLLPSSPSQFLLPSPKRSRRQHHLFSLLAPRRRHHGVTEAARSGTEASLNQSSTKACEKRQNPTPQELLA